MIGRKSTSKLKETIGLVVGLILALAILSSTPIFASFFTDLKNAVLSAVFIGVILLFLALIGLGVWFFFFRE